MSDASRRHALAVVVCVTTFGAGAHAAAPPAPVPETTPTPAPEAAPSPKAVAGPIPPAPPAIEPASPSAPTAMRYDIPLDLAITAGGAALWVTLELFKSGLATPCHWCDRNADGVNTLNGFDSSVRHALRWSDTRTADTLSSVFSFGLAPGVGIAIAAGIAKSEHRLNELPADLLVVAESAALAMDLNQVSKFGFARERPDVHARTPAERAALHTADDNLSFFSGHATLAFALSTSAGTIASMRHYRLAPVMWISGMVLATTGAYLRLAADRHYATDVVTGIFVGGAVGFSVPYFAHSASPLQPRLSALHVPGGGGVMLSGVF